MGPPIDQLRSAAYGRFPTLILGAKRRRVKAGDYYYICAALQTTIAWLSTVLLAAINHDRI